MKKLQFDKIHVTAIFSRLRYRTELYNICWKANKQKSWKIEPKSYNDTKHTGKFAQNFFHISVILGCIPLLFLQFWVKDYKNKPLTILEVIKETLGFILKIMKKIARWRHDQKISIKSMKTVISPLFLHFWYQHEYQKKQKHQIIQIFWFDPLLFNQNWINFEKPSKKIWFLSTCKVFNSLSIQDEK